MLLNPLGFWAQVAGGGLFIATINTNQQEMNLATWALANGWDGVSAAQITVGNGVYIWSNNTGTPALYTGNFAAGLTLVNNGYIMGRGGDGVYQGAGQAGGNAISLGCNTSIDNTVGYIGGGGGGGGGVTGGSYYASGGGGAGGGVGGSPSGGAGGNLGGSGANAAVFSFGGGGGRIFPSSSLAGPTYSAGMMFIGGYGNSGGGTGNCYRGIYGSASGGLGGGPGVSGGMGSGTGIGYGSGGGGGWGAPGGSAGGALSITYYAGGAGGKAVALNSYIVTWINSSKVYGSVS